MAALIGVVAYVGIDVILAILDPWYSLVRNAESDYGVGPHAWLMDLNFTLRCVFSLAAAAAIAQLGTSSAARRLGLAALITWAVASGALAFFPDNPAGTASTTPGRIHLLIAIVAFLAVAVGTIALSRHLRRGALNVIAWLGAAALVIVILGARPSEAYFGLAERTFLALEILWIAIAATYVLTPDR